MNAELIPALPSSVIWRLMDDGAVLVSPEGGKVRVLNEVGTTIWQLIDGKKNLGRIEEELLKKYDATREEIRQDLCNFLDDLEARHLIVWKGSTMPRGESLRG